MSRARVRFAKPLFLPCLVYPTPTFLACCLRCGRVDDWYPTTMAWGPWFDRYRDMLYRYFYPPNFQDRQPYLPRPGDKLKHGKMQVRGG
jgi:hypothetical protein